MIPKPSFLQNKVDQSGSTPNHYRGNQPNTFGGPPSNNNSSHRFPQQNFRNRARFQPPSHKDGTIRCNFKGCKFTGPQEVVKFHNEIQHLELRNKYNVDFTLNTPEDIAKWRAERRAKYPTFENVEKKDDVSKNNPTTSNNKNRERHQGYQRGKNRNSKNPNNYNNSYKRKFNYNHQSPSFENGNIKRNCTEQSILSNQVPNSTAPLKVEQPKKSPIEVQEKSKSTENHSLNLLSVYSSDEEINCLEPDCVPSNNNKLNELKLTKNPTANINETITEDNREEITAIAQLMDDLLVKTESILARNENETNCKVLKPIIKKRKRPNIAPLNYSKLNLFQKLMLQDVRKVKSELMEYLQVIVENNFFSTH